MILGMQIYGDAMVALLSEYGSYFGQYTILNNNEYDKVPSLKFTRIMSPKVQAITTDTIWYSHLTSWCKMMLLNSYHRGNNYSCST
mmetsp:Transcript_10555/g.19473  ORF Transcript_10555/g.19473 Transcript_10555/m.19473 type:complete len:86 (+) Transcript_10555:1214-1471(+)